MDKHRLINIFESLLMSADKAISLPNLLQIVNSYFTENNTNEIKNSSEKNSSVKNMAYLSKDDAILLLEELSLRYKDTSLELIQVSSGYRLQVKSDYSLWVSLLLEEKPQKYSRAFLETLALIAYKQPITRGEIEEVRGVSVSSQTIKTLTEREWIRIVGHRDVPGKPALFATTKVFLDYFSLNKLDELPALSTLIDIDKIDV